MVVSHLSFRFGIIILVYFLSLIYQSLFGNRACLRFLSFFFCTNKIYIGLNVVRCSSEGIFVKDVTDDLWGIHDVN